MRDILSRLCILKIALDKEGPVANESITPLVGEQRELP